MRKEIKELMEIAEELGWVHVRRTGSGHYMVKHPVTKVVTTIPSTPNGGKRGLKNAKQDLERWSKSPR